jgi:hypothetical protein
MAGLLLKELIIALLTFLLVTMSLGGSACAAPCGSMGLSDNHPCSLFIETPDLPGSPVPPCCISELFQGEQYVPSRKKSESRQIPIPLTAAAPTASEGADNLFSRLVRPRSWSFSERPGLPPLYVLHAVFLV